MTDALSRLLSRMKEKQAAAVEEKPVSAVKQVDFSVKVTTFDGREYTVPLEDYEADWQKRLPHIQRHCDALNCVAKRRGR